MAKPLAPEVRSKFAKRLKEMRVQSGFLRARYFANSLGVEENRYTRYERAEVEPNLTLIHKMCEILRVSPNELLGFAGSGGSSTPGFAENSAREEKPPEEAGMRYQGLLAWRLASETVAARNKHRTTAKPSGDPMATTRETAKLFQQLQSDPFGTIAQIAADDALKNLSADRKAEFADLIGAFTEHIATTAPGKPRG